MTIAIGDEVTFTPTDSRMDTVTGWVSAEVVDPFGNTGYNLLCPLPDQLHRTLRCWYACGTFTPTGRTLNRRDRHV